ncbi:hypothetical protein ONZ45_g8106 [Pleurotus djamor]|nr:hypothetical protein ONZ45_g8106 [Pleurotus djamor]
MDWLPNLHTLTCTVDDAILQLFAQPSVTTLQLEDFNKGSVSSPALSYLPVRMPALQRLSISGDFSRSDLIKNPEISTALQAVFSSMKELKYITLPQSLTLPSIVRPISTLPALTTLRVLFSRRNSTSAMELFDESLTPDSFSTLLDLDFHMPLLLATSQLTSQVRYKKLSRLVLTAHSATYPLNGDPAGTIDDLEELIQAISASCPMLEDFTLRSWSRDYYEEPENSGGFQVFTPITACHHLKALRLHYHWDVSVIDTDLLFLLSSLPQLTILYFMGTFHGEPDLHISVLSKIAVKYPSKLEELGLSVSTNPEQLPKTDEKINFIGLKKLSLTTSRITNDLAVAEYLSLLLSDDCHLDHMQGRWDKVKSYLPTLRRMLRYGGSRACSKCAS